MKRKPGRDLGVGLTPLIDVVFLLLIFFMVSATFLRESQIRVELPEARGSGDPEQDVLEVLVTRDGRYAVDGRALVDAGRETLRRALGAHVGDSGARPPLVVTADAAAEHRAVVRVMDVAAQLGFERLSISTREPES